MVAKGKRQTIIFVAQKDEPHPLNSERSSFAGSPTLARSAALGGKGSRRFLVEFLESGGLTIPVAMSDPKEIMFKQRTQQQGLSPGYTLWGTRYTLWGTRLVLKKRVAVANVMNVHFKHCPTRKQLKPPKIKTFPNKQSEQNAQYGNWCLLSAVKKQYLRAKHKNNLPCIKAMNSILLKKGWCIYVLPSSEDQALRALGGCGSEPVILFTGYAFFFESKSWH